MTFLLFLVGGLLLVTFLVLLGRLGILPLPPSDRPGLQRFVATPTGAAEGLKNHVALLIVLVTVAGSLLALRASSISGDGTDLAQEGMSELLLRERRIAEIDELVGHDRRLALTYREHAQLAVQLRKTGPGGAADAREHEALTRTFRARFLTGGLEGPGDDGTYTYDPALARRQAISLDHNLSALRPEHKLRSADRVQRKSMYVVGAGLLLVISLFFLTLSELARSSRERLLAVVGGSAMTLGICLYGVVEVLT